MTSDGWKVPIGTILVRGDSRWLVTSHAGSGRVEVVRVAKRGAGGQWRAYDADTYSTWTPAELASARRPRSKRRTHRAKGRHR